MYKYLSLLPILLLTGCIETVEIPVQINLYVCSSDGFQYTFENPPQPIVDEQGNQLTCEIKPQPNTIESLESN